MTWGRGSEHGVGRENMYRAGMRPWWRGGIITCSKKKLPFRGPMTIQVPLGRIAQID